MSTYNDDYNDHAPRASIFVHEETRSARVTYRSEDGREFRVMLRQKPNPIGFHAKLPGDRR